MPVTARTPRTTLFMGDGSMRIASSGQTARQW